MWVAVLASRLLVAISAAVAAAALPVTKSYRAPRGKLVPGISHPFGHGWLSGALDAVFTPLVRWDGLWYLEISHHGYTPSGLVPNNPGARPAFFPLYPLLVHALGGWAGNGATLVVATLLSLGAFTVGLLIVHRLATLELGPRAAKAAVLVIAFWPAGAFFSAPYTESLFLAVSAGAFLAARGDRWWLAGLLGAAASATRNTGVLLVIPLLVMYLYGPRSTPAPHAQPATGWRRWSPRFPVRRDILWLALVPLGLVAYSLYLQAEVGNWQAWRTVQTEFGRPHITTPITTIHLALTGVYHALRGGWEGIVYDPNILDALALVILIIAIVGMARRLPLPYTVWTVVAVTPPLVTPFLGEALRSLPRFMAVLFPIAMWLGYELTRHRRLLVPWLVVSGAMLVATTVAFTLWYPFV